MLSKRFKHLANALVVSLALLSVSPVLAIDIDDVVHGPSDHFIKMGVVVKNKTYSIYRSAALGRIGIHHLAKVLDEQELPFPKTIVYMNHAGYKFPLYFAIEEYKAGIKGKHGEFEFFHPFGDLRTYVDGHNPYFPTDYIDSDLYLGHRGRKYFEFGDGKVAGGVKTVVDVLNLVLDSERQPVLFHCLGGIHRTGMIAMLIRFLQGGFWVDGPKTESHGMQLNPAEYEYAKFNPIIFRKENIEFVEAFRNDPRFLALEAKYHDALQNDEKVFFNHDSEDEGQNEETHADGIED